ncbi:uncharacterized protein B0I36DRAFT_128526 [Microdochium trichocladiopsis]|uniref:Uncharacterized protein n=1 Tax=Microdochium trichocladiopsis TaxID=1682393 RepID=A0A9P8Y4C1_9PEZI|nr:uncharacterized protein B0I36DRAFT_128526 [Microdochium trichocladiopsis]KAH7029120.1 hypothetical protein B0I36DRAFT_128526 [Microdochium trichocladiopsis]
MQPCDADLVCFCWRCHSSFTSLPSLCLAEHDGGRRCNGASYALYLCARSRAAGGPLSSQVGPLRSKPGPTTTKADDEGRPATCGRWTMMCAHTWTYMRRARRGAYGMAKNCLHEDVRVYYARALPHVGKAPKEGHRWIVNGERASSLPCPISDNTLAYNAPCRVTSSARVVGFVGLDSRTTTTTITARTTGGFFGLREWMRCRP